MEGTPLNPYRAESGERTTFGGHPGVGDTRVREGIGTPGQRNNAPSWALPEEYPHNPGLRLEKWGSFNGDRSGRGGYRLVFPDGRHLPCDRCKTSWWESLGLFIGRTEGASALSDDLSHTSFDYGRPLRFTLRDGGSSWKSGRRIEVRNWEDDRAGGYVPGYLTSDVLRMAVSGDFAVVSLNGIWARSSDDPFSSDVSRVFLLWMIYRPGWIEGLDGPACPPIDAGS